MSDFSTQFQLYQQQVNAALKENFNFSNNLSFQAAAYSLNAPGKRLRPIIALATYEALAGKSATAEILAVVCSLEMFHTFSLIHDDLPALDNDTLRRGLPTCHTQFNEATAILAGDLLLNQAYLNLVHAKIAPELKVQLIQVLTQAAQNCVFGEQNDLLGEKKSLNQAELKQMFLDKTSALFGASFAFGAILSEVSPYQDFLSLGDNLGLAFQIQDDVLDVIGDQTILGKNIGSDEAEQKSTWVKLVGLEQAQQDYQNYYQQVEQKLLALFPVATSTTDSGQQFLLNLISSLKNRQK